jgi:hypothetical protein
LKFLIDNNLSPLWGKALRELSRNEPDVREVVSLRTLFPPNTKDCDWIRELGAASGWNVLSCDRFGKGNLEREALSQANLTVFRLQAQWTKARFWQQTAAIVKWWPDILEQARRTVSGAIIEVPYSHRGKFVFPKR